MGIYADHAATTPLCPPARAAMLEAMETCWANPSSLHTPGRLARDRLETARETVAACLGAEPGEIYFTAGGTESDNWAIRAAALAGARAGKRHVVASAMEHHAVLRTLEALEGFRVTLLPVREDGLVRPQDLENALEPDTCLVSVMWVNNEVGTVQPVEALGEICRRAGVPFHTDAVQAVGRLPVRAGTADLLSLSAHKFGGPRGAGALYVRRGLSMDPLLTGGAQERGRRAGTENLPAMAGMEAALAWSLEHMAEDAAHVSALGDRLMRGLEAMPGVRVMGDRQHRCPGIVSACFRGLRTESLVLGLDRLGISASGGAACAAGALEPSHVLLAMGVPLEEARGALRLSLGPENTPDEIETILEAVAATAARLRTLA